MASAEFMPPSGEELPTAYTIPHGWGEVAVTQAASEAYGIVPLTASTLPGYQRQEAARQPALRVLITGPDEFTLPNETPVTPDGAAFRARIATEVKPKEIRIATSFTASKEQYKRQALARMEDDSVAEFLAQTIGFRPEPVSEEQLDQALPQELIHMLGEGLENTVQESLAQWARMMRFRPVRRRASLFFGTALTSEAIPAFLFPGDEFQIASGGLIGLLYFGLGLQALRNYGRSMHRHEGEAQSAARATADLVHEAFHADFCSAHFDQRMTEGGQ